MKCIDEWYEVKGNEVHHIGVENFLQLEDKKIFNGVLDSDFIYEMAFGTEGYIKASVFSAEEPKRFKYLIKMEIHDNFPSYYCISDDSSYMEFVKNRLSPLLEFYRVNKDLS
ncbi:hypothetical protein AAEO50_12275 [Rossellomorea oryzaecorticis]|uniref:Uncharacterized protein n=1 Tax=Rossellomorea oryzaecorticis TaxID=1396505 RepID=A0ABU9KDW3_9BACI